MDEYKTLIYEPGPVTKIIHNEPETGNAMGYEFEKEFLDVLAKFEKDREARVAVSLANGKHFTAGHDIANLSKKQSWKPGEKVEWNEATWRRINDPRKIDYPLWEVSKPLVVGVQGAVIGAGITFVMLHDVVVMGESAFFSAAITRVSGAFGGLCHRRRRDPAERATRPNRGAWADRAGQVDRLPQRCADPDQCR